MPLEEDSSEHSVGHQEQPVAKNNYITGQGRIAGGNEQKSQRSGGTLLLANVLSFGGRHHRARQ